MLTRRHLIVLRALHQYGPTTATHLHHVDDSAQRYDFDKVRRSMAYLVKHGYAMRSVGIDSDTEVYRTTAVGRGTAKDDNRHGMWHRIDGLDDL